MWDAEIVSRILDRKQNEAVVYAVMMKNNADLDKYCTLIDNIIDDIRFCSEIVKGGDSDVRTVAIACPEYMSRLSDSEKSDESYLDSIRKAPESVASDSDEVEHLKVTIQDLMDELSIIKKRNEELSLDLDYAKAEIKSEQDDCFGIEVAEEPEVEAPAEEVPAVEEAPAVEDAPVEVAPAVEVVEDAPAEEVPAVEDEMKTLDQIPDDPMNITEVDKIVAKRVKAVKSAKMDYFIDLSMSGKNVKACEDIIAFLKIDCKLCDVVANVDTTNEEALIKAMNDMLDLVDSETKSPYQRFYVKNLTPQEKVFETMFNGLMEKIQRIMFVKLPIGA